MILIINLNEKNLGVYEFCLPLYSIVSEIEECTIQHYTRVESFSSYRKVILSGTPLMDNDHLDNINDFQWLKTCDIPVLGICAGMQVIGLVFGSVLVPCLEIGMTQIIPLKENLLVSSSFSAYALHRYGILPSDDFHVLARSNLCVQAMKHIHLDLYGVLFHPEVRNKEVIRQFVLAP
jgi:GMP synthase-like glutamine amidotransferase